MNTKSRKRTYSSAHSESVSPTPLQNNDYLDYDNSSPKSGKWTPEEEQFANRLIQDFELGLLLDCENGCTLRSYLARKLNCAPMRISKKFAGQCIGKHVFQRKPENDHMIKEEYPPAKFLKLTLQEMHQQQQVQPTRDSTFFRRDSNTSDLTADSTDSLSCDNEFDEISNVTEAAEWKDVLSFFCGEFKTEENDFAFGGYNYNNYYNNNFNNMTTTALLGNDLLFDFREENQ